MRNKFRKGLVFGLAILLATTLVVIIETNNVTATTYTVGIAGSGADYNSIQAAIDALTGAGPHTIYVWAGTYYENVVIDETLTMIGNSTSDTIINGGGTGDVVQITANYVIFKNFTITNSGSSNSGIYMTSDYCNITNINCSNNGYGINLYYADNNMIGTHNEGINLTANIRNSIKLYHSWDNDFTNIDISQITTNYASIHGSAILLDWWDRDNVFDTITISENYDTSNASTTYYNGFHIDVTSTGFSGGNTLNNSEIKNTKNGVVFTGSASNNNKLDKNKIHLNKENGVFFNDTHGNVITNHKTIGSDSWGIYNNDKHGIYLNKTENTNVSFNYIYDNNNNNNGEGDGIYLKDCGDAQDTNDIEIIKNGIYNTGSGNQQYGIHLYNITETTIQDHNENYNNSYGIYKNKKDGIFIDSSVDTGSTIDKIQSNWIYENEDNGIRLLDSNGIKINKKTFSGYRNKIYDNKDDGIRLEDSDNITIDDNIIYNSAASKLQKNGIHLKKDAGGGESTDNSITSNNTIYYQDNHGIYMEYGENNTIEGATVYDNNDDNSGGGDGIRLEYSKNNNITGCIIENANGGDEYQQYGIYLLESDDNSINGSTILNNKKDGIYINSGSDGNKIERTDSSSNTGNGLYIEGTSTNKPKNNLIRIDNNFQLNGDNGIYLKYAGTSGNPNKIYTSEVTNNWDHGIKLEISDHNEIKENIISDNDNTSMAGIYLDDSTYTTIEGNDIGIADFGNDFGIYLTDTSTDNIINKNTIYDNDDYGVNISNSNCADNEIYHNDFIDNNGGGIQAWDDGDGSNLWNKDYSDPFNEDNDGGNYWNDHDEIEEGIYDQYQGSEQDEPGDDQIADDGDPIGGKNPYAIETSGLGSPEDTYPYISRRTS